MFSIYINIMTEIDDFINSNQKLSKLTLQSYRSSYRKIMKLLKKDDDNLKNVNQKDIISVLEQNVNSPATKRQVLNSVIQLRRHFKTAVKHLLTYRDKLQNELDKHRIETNKIKKEELPSFNELRLFLKEQYIQDKQSYIINFLLTEYNVRNKDIDLIILNNMKKATDKKDNYLVVNPKSIVYIRNDYKTHEKYGEKKARIVNKKFVNAVNEYYNENKKEIEPLYLASTKSGGRLDETSIHKFIRSKTLNGISEGDINKISVSRVKNIKDVAILKKISKNRGTSVENLINYYNLNIPI